ncbi:hypothetical protein ACWEMY_29080, partial [Nocardia sp. NPDC004415]
MALPDRYLHATFHNSRGIERGTYSRARRFSGVLIAILMASGLSGVASAPSAFAQPSPPLDDFYGIPDGLADTAPGTVLKSRSVDLKQLQLLPLDVAAWQLLYRTVDADGKPDAAVTTVMLPHGEAKPRPLLSFQAATDSTLRICNPSYGLTAGLPIEPDEPAGPVTFALPAAEIAFAVAGLENGWAVAIEVPEDLRTVTQSMIWVIERSCCGTEEVASVQ